MKVWIGRDGVKSGKQDKDLFLFTSKPVFDDGDEEWQIAGSDFCHLPGKVFPEIKNGECYEAEITLGEKVYD